MAYSKILCFFIAILIVSNIHSQDYNYDSEYNSSNYVVNMSKLEREDYLNERTMFFSSLPNSSEVKREFLNNPKFYKEYIVKTVKDVTVEKTNTDNNISYKKYKGSNTYSNVKSSENWLVSVTFQNFNWNIYKLNFLVSIYKHPSYGKISGIPKYQGILELIDDVNHPNYIGHPKPYDLEKNSNYEENIEDEENVENQEVEYYTYERYDNGTLKRLDIIDFDDNYIGMRSYYENGKLNTYHDIKQLPNTKNYYPNGNLKGTGNYIKNMPNGEFITYYENGNLASTSNYINGVKNGMFKSYDRDGQLISKVKWEENKVIDIINFNSNGSIIKEHISKELSEKRSSEIKNILNSEPNSQLVLLTSTDWCNHCVEQLKAFNNNSSIYSFLKVYVVDYRNNLSNNDKSNFSNRFPNLNIQFVTKENLGSIREFPSLYFYDDNKVLVKEIKGNLGFEYIEYYVLKLL